MRSATPQGPPSRSAGARCSPTSSTPRARVTARAADRRRLAGDRGASARRFADEADFALQDEPRGTARRGPRRARMRCPRTSTEIVVLNGDVPLVDPALHRRDLAGRAPRRADAAVALVTVDVDEPAGLGRVVRDERRARERHRRGARRERATQLAIDEINAGLYAFDVGLAAPAPRRTSPPSPVTGELYLPLLVALARADDRAGRRARGRGRRHAAGHQRPRRAGRRRGRDAHAHQRARTCAPA